MSSRPIASSSESVVPWSSWESIDAEACEIAQPSPEKTARSMVSLSSPSAMSSVIVSPQEGFSPVCEMSGFSNSP
ncbi:MAG: hypothetical protein J07HB67_02433 [halophilic archaeon J07HB67]|nr:MAG: hypothetical protein J07HB67_02433 [halophilic archaeon J07HB67]